MIGQSVVREVPETGILELAEFRGETVRIERATPGPLADFIEQIQTFHREHPELTLTAEQLEDRIAELDGGDPFLEVETDFLFDGSESVNGLFRRIDERRRTHPEEFRSPEEIEAQIAGRNNRNLTSLPSRSTAIRTCYCTQWKGEPSPLRRDRS